MSVGDRGDPRTARTRRAVLAAARTLLQQEGPSAVTHQRAAAAAGVGRATVYRHWPRPEALLYDAMRQVDLPFFTDIDDGLQVGLRRDLRRLADELTLPAVRQIAATLLQTSQWDPTAQNQLAQWLDTITQRLHQAVLGAIARGEVSPRAAPADPTDTVALLLGPLVHRTLLQGETVSDALLDRVIATALPTWQHDDRPTAHGEHDRAPESGTQPNRGESQVSRRTPRSGCPT